MQSFELFFTAWQIIGMALGLLVLIIGWWILQKKKKSVYLAFFLPSMCAVFPFAMSYVFSIFATLVYYPSMIDLAIAKSALPLAIVVAGSIAILGFLIRRMPKDMEADLERQMKEKGECEEYRYQFND